MALRQGFSTIILAIAIFSCILLTLGFPQKVPKFEKGSDALKFAPLIDGHNDLPYTLYKKVNNDLRQFSFEKNLTDDPLWGKAACNTCHTDLPRLIAGKVGGQLWSAYVECDSQYKDAVQLTLRQIDVIKKLVKKYPANLEFVTDSGSIEKSWKNGKIASMIGVEGGHSLDSSLAVLRLYHELGVRYVTLTHSCNTPWIDASPYKDQPVHNITGFGEKVIMEMNRLGMMIDLSHVSHNVMSHIIERSQAPVIFSHSSVYELCKHHRNVPDDVLKLVKKNNGIVMVNFFNGFIKCASPKNATIEDVVAHINYIRNLIGVDHIGIGGDYNGVPQTPAGLEDVSKFPTLFDRLHAHKEEEPEWSQEDLEKIAGRNFIRVFKDVEKVRDEMSDEPPIEDIIDGKELKIAQEKEGLIIGSCQTAKEWENIKHPDQVQS